MDTEFPTGFEQQIVLPFNAHRLFQGIHNRGQDVSAEEASQITRYLEDPVATGLWRLATKWNEANGISNDIWSDLDKELGDGNSIQIQTGKRERKIRITEERKQVLKTNVFGKLSFLMGLFQYLAQQATGQTETADSTSADQEDVQLILDLIDTSAIAKKYADALEFFQQNLWHQHFETRVFADTITRLKAGSFILLQGPRDADTMVFISWHKEPLQATLTFLEMLGKVCDAELLPVFSPEEEVFAPYFDLLGIVQSKLISQQHLQPVVSKGLSNFAEDNFIDCVSSIGLAAEDVLTQVFETLFREQLVKGLTLGQLVDEIHSRSSQWISKKEDSPPDMSPLFAEIKSALETEAENNKTTLEIVRRFLAQTIESDRYLQSKLDKLGRVEKKISVFPEKVSYLLTELIRFRNAASHRSRIPIGPYECRRSAYAFVVLYTWWQREKRAIDWSRDPKTILLECVQRNTG